MTSSIPRAPVRFRPRALVGVLGVLWLAGCASGGAARGGAPAGYQTRVSVQPAAVDSAAALPPLPVAQLDAAAGAARRIRQLEVVDQDLRLVVRSLAESFGLDYQIDPAVQGRVTTRLQGVTLQEALDAVVLPQGYSYQLQGRVLRVAPARVQTRIFSLDYMSLSRSGVGTTVVQRRLSSTGTEGQLGGGGAVGGSGGGGAAGDIIQSVSVADLWQELRISLEGLVFDAAAQGSGGDAAPAGAGAGGALGAHAPGAFSRVDADGRRLIINPLSGTIVVAAPPARLDEIAALLGTIEGSVQRQVLIEAKIVEVSLNENFQFGIDWNAVARLGNVSLRVNGGQSATQFTLNSPGSGASGQIGVVLNALESQGNVSVLSSPRVSVMNNQRAVMNVTTDQVFFSVTRQPVLGPTGAAIGFNTEIVPQQVAVGIVLDVLAQIAPDNTITMNVRPVITNVVDTTRVQLEDGTQASAPVIDRRETDTVVRIRGGETIVIGGLMQTTQRRTESGVPGLREIPGLGRLFGGARRQTEKRELVIFITPTVVAGQPSTGR